MKKEEEIRLNKFISNAGVCSRREADKLIAEGQITVNGKVVTSMGVKVSKKDDVRHNGKRLINEKPVYVLLNKPKGFITTSKDPKARKTVMQLVEKASDARIYPVGRLDRMTTGLLLFTNDGELAKKLTHPRYNIKKLYKVDLDRKMTKAHFEKLQGGFELEDGFIKPDELAFTDDKHRTIGIAIHSGKNRIVRRMMEHLGYNVVHLDRVLFAGLDKKNLPRGRWRHLDTREVGRLKRL